MQKHEVMKHFVKTLVLATMMWAVGCAAYAIDKKALADSLTVYANRFANVGKVEVKRIRVDQNHANIFTNGTLSCLSLNDRQIADLRNIAAAIVFPGQDGDCQIFTDGYELTELLADNLRKQVHYTLPEQRHPLVCNTSRTYKADRGLDGFHIALYGSHGIYYNQLDERWTFQRARLLTTVEDLYTTSYTMTFLVPMLENAGAVVLQPRERDTQLNEVIVDDSDVADSQFNTAHTGGFATPRKPLTEGVNPFTAGGYSYLQASTDKDSPSLICYRPHIPQEGDYAVYVSYKTLPNSTAAAHYTVRHNGIETNFDVNQKMAGGTWVYLGTFFFSQDTADNCVSLTNYGKAGTIVTSDAVKFGGGMGSVARYRNPEATENVKSDSPSLLTAEQPKADIAPAEAPASAQTSGFPRYIEGARYWLQYAGIPDSVYNFKQSTNDYTDDYAARGRWMNWLIGGSPAYPQGKGLGIPVHLGLAFHSDAGLTLNDSIVGTLAIYMDTDDDRQKTYPTGISRLAARNYSDIVQTQIVQDIRATFAPEWQRRQLKNSSYSEARNPKIPVMLLELLSHQNPADMKYGLDPRFRFVVSRAIYKGMLRYLHEQYGTAYVVQPLPVRDFAIDIRGTDSLVLSWQPQTDTLESTANADHYVLYTRTEDSDWDNGIRVKDNSFVFVPDKDRRYDFRVVAANRGGISFPSQTLSALLSSNEQQRILIVNGFDRISAPDHFQKDSAYFGFIGEAVPYGKQVNYIGQQYEYDWSKPWITDDNGGFGSSYMDHADCWSQGNTFDYPVMHGKALARHAGISYYSTSASALTAIPHSVNAVDYILGKQKLTRIGTGKQTVDFPTFTPQQRQMLADYVSSGGNLLVSGAYITSDEAADNDFLKNTLHIKPASRRASRSGKLTVGISGTQQAAQLLTEPNTQTIHCENPDGIAPADSESKACARYKDSFIAAGVMHNHTDSVGKTIVFSFPLESLQDFTATYTEAVNWIVSE